MNLNQEVILSKERTHPMSTYIKIEMKIKGYHKYHLHAYIDTGASMCVASKHVIPEELWVPAKEPIGVRIADASVVIIDKVAHEVLILIEGEEFYIPTVYQQETGIDFLIGNNFLKLYRPFIQDLREISITNNLNPKKKVQVITNIVEHAYRLAQPGFTDQYKKQNRGEVTKLKKPTQIMQIEVEINITDNIYLQQITQLDVVKQRLLAVCSENPIGKTNTNTELAELILKDPTKVIRVKPMSYTPVDREIFAGQIREMLEQGVIRQSTSPHCSPAFLVENESEIRRGKKRMVINYKALNKETQDDGYFLPNKESLLALIREKKYFTGLDCKSGFWQIRLKEESKPLTAFSCPQGHYEWNVVPFGLKQAPGIFQRWMDTCFKVYHDFCCVYVDDILVFSKTEEEHFNHVLKIIEVCKEKGIVLSEKKAKLFQTKINFLGLEIEEGSLKMQNHIMDNIQKFPSKMESKVHLQRFLGCLTYAEGYIKKLAEVRKPLQKYLKKDAKWNWSDADTAYVDKVKKHVKDLPVLYHPKEEDLMILETDASNEFWGGVLKARDKDQVEHLCRYTSGSFQGSELNYHSNEKEYLAIKKAIKKFSIYLTPKRFEVRTDSKNFGYFLRTNIEGDYKQGRLLRWQQWFNYYQFEVVHIPGHQNCLADAMTRELANCQETFSNICLSEQIISIQWQPTWKYLPRKFSCKSFKQRFSKTRLCF